MKSKCINIAVMVAFLFAGLLVTGSAFGQTETDARNFAPTSLHTTIKGMEIFYTTDGTDPGFIGAGYESLTGVPYNTLGCKDCHDPSNPKPYTDPDACDKCHTDLVTFTDAIPNSTCAGCHGRQNKEAAKGFTDVHDTAYPNCADCHTWTDLHGDGTAYNSMLEPGAVTTSCEGCHTGTSPVGPAVDASHDPHAGKLHCSACHVKSVITCYNCHFDSEVDGFGKIANTALGANDKNAGFVLLLNYEGQVRTGTYQSLVFDDGNEFVAYAPFHGHSVGTGADARTCDDCHMNDNIVEYNNTGKIVLTSWNGSAIVQEATGAIPLIDGAMELAYVDLLSRSPNVWGSLGSGTGTVQYGFGTPLTESQITALSFTPPPPVRQELGLPDTSFNNLTEAECRMCHPGMVNRHHLLYGDSIAAGECSDVNGTCSVAGTPCVADADCPVGETCDPGTPAACLKDEDCAQPLDSCFLTGDPCPVGLCDDGITSCTVDGDCAVGESCNAGSCPSSWTGQFCGQPICYGQTAVLDSDADSDGSPDSNYGCLNCHIEDNTGGIISFEVERNCTVCHQVGLNQPTVHHQEGGIAQSGQCVICHGDLVDDPLGCKELCCAASFGPAAGQCTGPCTTDADCGGGELCVALGDEAPCDDGHVIPTYTPSLVTPAPVTDNEAGGCNFCHDAGLDTEFGVEVLDNHDTHHDTGVYRTRFGDSQRDKCAWCHKAGSPHNAGGHDADAIRFCENCHGYESLHNIQADSPNPANPGTIVVGAEDPWYGHIGIDDPNGASDCWGCHGFTVSSAPTTGPIIPTLADSSAITITAGEETTLTLSGSAFTNVIGDFTWLSEVQIGDLTLVPTILDQGEMTVTIPALYPGIYDMRVVKGDVESNPIVINCVPGVTIDSVDCADGVLTVTGSGFGEEPPAGAEEFLNVKMGDAALDITSWTDTQIVANTTICGGEVTVNALYGSASAGEDCCEGDLDADGDVDGSDASGFKSDFGRSQFSDPCTDGTCAGDFDCDGDQDGTDASLFKSDFGRSALNNACPGCTADDCSY
jgi:hypothetical protein